MVRVVRRGLATVVRLSGAYRRRHVEGERRDDLRDAGMTHGTALVRGERDVGVDRVGFVETNDVGEHVERGDRAEARRDGEKEILVCVGEEFVARDLDGTNRLVRGIGVQRKDKSRGRR